MKTWRNILIFVSLVSFVACTKVVDVCTPENISYSVSSYAAATKATDFSETSFSSSAWLHAGGSETGSLFMNAETITKNNDIWAPERDYYWPTSPQSYLNFVSWYDAAGNPAVSESQISWTNRTVGEQDLILLAQKAWKQKSNTRNYYRYGVPTLFRNLLAEVEFKAQAAVLEETEGSVTTSWEIVINSFEVNGVHSTSSITLTNDTEPTVQDGAPVISEWTSTGWSASSAVDQFSADDDVTLTTSPQDVIARRSVLPQAVDGISLSIDCSITTTCVNGSVQHTLVEPLQITDLALGSFSGAGDWEMNKRITYTITIDPRTGLITIVPTVDNWSSNTSELIVE